MVNGCERRGWRRVQVRWQSSRDGRESIVRQLRRGASVGTRLTSDKARARTQAVVSIASLPKGSLALDDGAVKSIRKGGRSLLRSGFQRSLENLPGDLVRCTDSAGREVARGLVNYNTDEASQLLGSNLVKSRLLGYGGDPEMIHCDNLVIT